MFPSINSIIQYFLKSGQMIYLLKTHQINVSNLVQALLFKNAINFSLDPCSYTLINNRFFQPILGKFVKRYSASSEDFRMIDWTNKISALSEDIALIKSQNKIIISGANQDNQINLLKKHFGSDIISVGINYTNNIYQNLLNNLVETHIYKLNNGLLPMTDRDQSIMTSMSAIDSFNYYINAFNDIKLIPNSHVNQYDYNIYIDDFTDKIVMSTHFRNLNLPFTPESSAFYDFWLSNQTTFN